MYKHNRIRRVGGSGGGGGGAPFLDNYITDIGAAFSLRRAVTSYEGSAIRVRETGGDTLADIGFNASGDLDTDALLDHCGVNSGFVHTWYEQIHGYDISHATSGNQPRIVNAGVVDTVNGKPSLRFLNGQFLFRAGITTADILSANQMDLYAVTLMDASEAIGGLWDYWVNDGANFCQIWLEDGSSRIIFSYPWTAEPILQPTQPVGWDDALHVLMAIKSGSTGSLTVDGTQIASGNLGGSSNLDLVTAGLNQLRIGNGGGNPLIGNISEIFWHRQNKSDFRSDIQTNLGSYYGVTLA